MRAATHQGHCQWCGRLQMLPGGRLAKHGYEVREGWFSGICRGADHLPYELSCDLIQASIDSARSYAGHLETTIKALQAIDARKATHTWAHEYRKDWSSRTKGSVYHWREVEVTSQDEWTHEYVGYDKKSHRLAIGKRAKVIAEGIQGYAKHLGAEMRKLREYADQQAERLKTWAPHPEKLVPVAKPASVTDPIYIGQQRRLASGTVVTVSRVDGPRIYWTYPAAEGKTRTGWTGTAAFRKFPKVDPTTTPKEQP